MLPHPYIFMDAGDVNVGSLALAVNTVLTELCSQPLNCFLLAESDKHLPLHLYKYPVSTSRHIANKRHTGDLQTPVSRLVYREMHEHMLPAFSPAQCSVLSRWGQIHGSLYYTHSRKSLEHSSGITSTLPCPSDLSTLPNTVLSHSSGDF